MFGKRWFPHAQSNSNLNQSESVGVVNESYIAMDQINDNRVGEQVKRFENEQHDSKVGRNEETKGEVNKNNNLKQKGGKDTEENSGYCTERRGKVDTVNRYRVGPAPLVECQREEKRSTQSSVAMLDSDLEEEDDDLVMKKVENRSIPSSRGLFIYFERLSKSMDEGEKVDLQFVESLLATGANINFTDRYGQTILHTIVKDWHPDIASFVIERGANVNHGDKYGRTPLHVAAAVDYPEMVEFLLSSKANMEAATKGEEQTAMHYAAKCNAVLAMKVLIENGADVGRRDYRGRTPCFLASEFGRIEATQHLLDIGVPTGVFDSQGSSTTATMVAKVPSLAPKAFQQFYHEDKALRKSFYYLAHLERGSGKSNIKLLHTSAQTTLEVIVFFSELSLVTHPVIKKLIAVKWDLFGRNYMLGYLMINLLYALMWTALAFAHPRDGHFYTPLDKNAWRITMDIILVLLTVYLIAAQILEARTMQSRFYEWQEWKCQLVDRDLIYSHPRWPDERRFLNSELQRLKRYRSSYLKSGWNIIEWIAILMGLFSITTRIIYIAQPSDINHKIHRVALSLTLLMVWIRLMRICQGFAFLSAFVTLLGHVIADTIMFAFLFFEFFIPYVCAFWMLFGGEENAALMKAGGQESNAYARVDNLLYTIWTMTLMGDFDLKSLEVIDETLAHIMTATYFGLVSIICLNLYIALMSETFSRVYGNASANACLQQARLMLNIEKGLNAKKQKMIRKFFRVECSPLEVYDDGQTKTIEGATDIFAASMRDLQEVTGSTKEMVKSYVAAATKDSKLNNPRKMAKKINDIAKQQAEFITWMKESQSNIIEQQRRITNALERAGFSVGDPQEGNSSGMFSYANKLFTSEPSPSSSPLLRVKNVLQRSMSDNELSSKASKDLEMSTEESPDKKTKRKRRGRSKQR